MNNDKPKPNAAVLEMQISIEVSPAPTFDELLAMQADMVSWFTVGAGGAVDEEVRQDKNAFMDAINREVIRCKPKPAWMRRPNQSNQSNEPVPPTSHARIDSAQSDQLKGILKPETLRRTFISIPALIAQIQADIQVAVQALAQAQAAPKTQAEMDAEAEAELLQARRM